MRKELITVMLVVLLSLTSIALAVGDQNSHQGPGNWGQDGIDDDLIMIEIDVKPNAGSGTPTIDTSDKVECVPILAYGSAIFNVDEINMETLKINGVPATAVIITPGWYVNDDGFDDVVLDFVVDDLVASGALEAGQTSLKLEGELVDGRAFEGSDDVNVI